MSEPLQDGDFCPVCGDTLPSHTPDCQDGPKPSIPEVIGLFRKYHEQHPAWHSLHVVLDDGNVSDLFVDYCIELARVRGDTEGGKLARLLRRMSRTQRLKLAQVC